MKIKKTRTYVMLAGLALIIVVIAGFLIVKGQDTDRDIVLMLGDSASMIYIDPEGEDYDGLSLIAESFANDVLLVTGVKPIITTDANELAGTRDKITDTSHERAGTPIIVGSHGQNEVIDKLIEDGKIDADAIKDRWETYQIRVVKEPLPGIEEAIVVVGSDKRGTIYGIYHISELIGVSPWVYWADVLPEQKTELLIPASKLNLVSKEPSVKYRGIFLNDEWPSLGAWTGHQFGGFNEDFYGKVYELILRLKGNYLWPAMWSASFSEDGKAYPIANAELADRYGIVMGTSHHEPMFRQGVEWQRIYSQYGNNNAWDYTQNSEAITKFWEDGVIRNKSFESVVTLGMRGEADSALGGGLEDNIQLLKDVITVQKELLDQHGLEQIPKVLTIYKEVEKFWHGTESIPGLKEWDQLDDVTIMLTDDNFGNVRTLPTEEERQRAAGWGMYYHFDYHGGPTSYEWINTIPLEKVWEQMSMAYDYGVRDIWIVNVGDLKPMELPISYFLDLAYDFDTWGTSGINKTQEYIASWARQQFGHVADEETVEGIAQVMADYTRLNGIRKPEVTRADTYSVTNDREAARMLARAIHLEERVTQYKELMPDSHQAAYDQLVYYPAAATANVKKMHLYAGMNQKYFGFYHQSVLANWYAALTEEAIRIDEQLQFYYNNTMAGGKWKGMMSSPHIGYVTWDSTGWQYPQVNYVTPLDGSQMIVDVDGSGHAYISGTVDLPLFTNVGDERYLITISNGGTERFDYEIESEVDWIKLSTDRGTVQIGQQVEVSIDWSRVKESASGVITISGADQIVQVNVHAELIETKGLPKMTFVETHGAISIEAEHTTQRKASSEAEWVVIEHYGRTLSSVKMFPTTVSYDEPTEAPYLEYTIRPAEEGMYTLTAYFAPTNNLHMNSRLRYAISVDDGDPVIKDVLKPDFVAGDSGTWGQAVTDNIHASSTTHRLTADTHTFRIYGLDAGLVLQRLVWSKEPLPYSYLGPIESYYVGKQEQSRIHHPSLETDERASELDLFPEGRMKPRLPDWGDGPFAERDGDIWIEAEIALEQSEYAYVSEYGQHAWKAVEGASHLALQLLPDNGGSWTSTYMLNGFSSELTFQVDFLQSGAYHVWLLSHTPTATSDSIHVGLDDSQQFSYLNFHHTQDYAWQRVGTLTVDEAGLHDVNFWGREDGIAIDKIYLSRVNEQPQGTGGEVVR